MWELREWGPLPSQLGTSRLYDRTAPISSRSKGNFRNELNNERNMHRMLDYEALSPNIELYARRNVPASGYAFRACSESRPKMGRCFREEIGDYLS
jgi:hypothetical protein